MPYLVDGNNLLGLAPEDRERRPGARSSLARRLADFARARRAKLTVVFDGEPEPGARGPTIDLGAVRVIYAGRGVDADSLILRILRDADDPGNHILVTNDRSLADRARHMRARVEACARFQRRMDEVVVPSAEREGGLTPDAIAEWEAWFQKGRE